MRALLLQRQPQREARERGAAIGEPRRVGAVARDANSNVLHLDSVGCGFGHANMRQTRIRAYDDFQADIAEARARRAGLDQIERCAVLKNDQRARVPRTFEGKAHRLRCGGVSRNKKCESRARQKQRGCRHGIGERGLSEVRLYPLRRVGQIGEFEQFDSVRNRSESAANVALAGIVCAAERRFQVGIFPVLDPAMRNAAFAQERRIGPPRVQPWRTGRRLHRQRVSQP